MPADSILAHKERCAGQVYFGRDVELLDLQAAGDALIRINSIPQHHSSTTTTTRFPACGIRPSFRVATDEKSEAGEAEIGMGVAILKGIDTTVDFFRLDTWSAALKAGDLISTWTPTDANGFGSPVPFFYHKLFNLAGAALTLATGDIVIAFRISVLFFRQSCSMAFTSVRGVSERIASVAWLSLWRAYSRPTPLIVSLCAHWARPF